MLVAADEAWRIGLVDELAPEKAVVPRALARCEKMLALPPTAMTESRRHARADLVYLFDQLTEETLDQLVEDWFSDETQAAMNALVARLAGK